MLCYQWEIMIFKKNILFSFISIITFFSISSFFVLGEEKSMQFSINEESNWIFFTDGVMGGISKGRMERITENKESFLRLKGTVSTENNGGFIQVRHEISNLSNDLKKINLFVRGNNQDYHVFIRTKRTLLPWQFYSSKFFAKNEWTEIELKIEDFKKSGFLLSKNIIPSEIKSIGIVAYGRDFEALIDLKNIQFLN